jgi:hypothetical protein
MPALQKAFKKPAKTRRRRKKVCEQPAKTCWRCNKPAKSTPKHAGAAKSSQKERENMPALQKILQKARMNMPALQKVREKRASARRRCKNIENIAKMYFLLLLLIYHEPYGKRAKAYKDIAKLVAAAKHTWAAKHIKSTTIPQKHNRDRKTRRRPKNGCTYKKCRRGTKMYATYKNTPSWYFCNIELPTEPDPS